MHQCTWADTGHQREARCGLQCRRCYFRTRRRITDAVAAYGWLGENMTRLTGGWHEPVKGTSDTDPAWLDLHDLRTDVAGLLHSWAGNLASDLHQCLTIAPEQVALTGWYLLGNLVHAGDWITDMDAELDEQLRQVHAVSPWRREARRLPVPCPSCDLLTLVLFGGDDFVTCLNRDCREVAIPGYRYERWVRRLLADHKITVAA